MFAKYDLFKPTTFIQNCIYMNFRTILTQSMISLINMTPPTPEMRKNFKPVFQKFKSASKLDTLIC